ncbi:hypothetical protein KKC45_02070, partial [Patescibacteria group bacterium]|nr:hypothetical protein [Patescibacteria group bacterium]
KNELIRMATYSLSLLGIVLYVLSAGMLDFAPYVTLLLIPFPIISIVGIFFIEEKTNLTKKLFLITSISGFLFSLFFAIDYWQYGKSDITSILYLLPLSSIFLLISVFLTKKYGHNLFIKKEKTLSIIYAIILSIITLIGIVLFLFSSALLYPIGYFASALMVFLIFSVVGIFFIYKRPSIAKNLFSITVAGTFLTIFSYIISTEQDWTFFRFVFGFLGTACFLLLFSAYLIRKYTKN